MAITIALDPPSPTARGIDVDHLSARFARGEPDVLASIEELASFARRARAALSAGDLDELALCVDGSFDARRRMIALDPRHVEMIERARACGASANYTGSGGAIVGVCRDEPHRTSVIDVLRAGGCLTAELLAP